MLGFSLAILIGMSLGLLGGGGSILTVPILVYAMGMDAKLSIALSLAIVGATSLIGVYGHYKKQNVDLKIAMIFGPVAMVGTSVGAKLSQFLSGQTQLILFALIMIAASFFMIKGRKETEGEQKKINYPLIIIQAIIVGIITGLVGVGGGFLIVPALVLLTGIPMKKAVGTSLFIITLNCVSGFLSYLSMFTIPWGFLLKFILFSGCGIFLGTYLVKFVSQQQLRRAFGVFLIVMGVFILYKNRSTFMTSAQLPILKQKIIS